MKWKHPLLKKLRKDRKFDKLVSRLLDPLIINLRIVKLERRIDELERVVKRLENSKWPFQHENEKELPAQLFGNSEQEMEGIKTIPCPTAKLRKSITDKQWENLFLGRSFPDYHKRKKP